MRLIIDELRQIISEYSEKFSGLSQTETHEKPQTDKWSKKEIIGHLIDSAHTNLRRFIVGQYENKYPIIYNQNFWVSANNYQNTSISEIIVFWKLINERICAVLQNMPSENYTKEVNTSREDNEPQLHSILWLAEDYVKHMKHHINQVLPGSFSITYP